MRASSDLLLNCNTLIDIIKIECITLDNDNIQEHSIDIETRTIETDNPEIADPVLTTITTMLHHII